MPPSSTLAASSSHALLASSFREKRGACETDDEGVFSIRPSDLVKGRRLKKAKSPPPSEALTKQQSNGGGGGGPVFIPPKFESPSGGLIKPSEYLRSLRPDAAARGRHRREAKAAQQVGSRAASSRNLAPSSVFLLRMRASVGFGLGGLQI